MNRRLPNNTEKHKKPREHFIRRSRYYHTHLLSYMKGAIPENSSVLEIGCGNGNLLRQLPECRCTGIDISEAFIEEARSFENGHTITYLCADAESYQFTESYDVIIIADTLAYIYDIQRLFSNIRKACHQGTRLLITYHNFLWQPLLSLSELISLKMPQKRLNWLGGQDVANLLAVENFEAVSAENKFLIPIGIPILAPLLNRFLVHVFPFNHTALSTILTARPIPAQKEYSVSIIIPARNEYGNIEQAILRMPSFGLQQEIIFIEGNSTDQTYDEIIRVAEKYHDKFIIKYAQQPGKGKGDAVRKGFSLAENELLFILDADLTVMPEDLPKFYRALCDGKGELINGTRLVYPLEKDSMRFLNMLGNKFFSLLFSWLLGQPVKDTLCGTKVLHRKHWEQICSNRPFFGEFDPFGDFDILFGAARLNLKITEIPIRYQARVFGSTNISRFRHGWLLIKMSFFALFKLKFR